MHGLNVVETFGDFDAVKEYVCRFEPDDFKLRREENGPLIPHKVEVVLTWRHHSRADLLLIVKRENLVGDFLRWEIHRIPLHLQLELSLHAHRKPVIETSAAKYLIELLSFGLQASFIEKVLQSALGIQWFVVLRPDFRLVLLLIKGQIRAIHE